MKLLTDEEICKQIFKWHKVWDGDGKDVGWDNDKGEVVEINTPPLTSSLDAQKEYLWPLLSGKGITVRIFSMFDGNSRVTFYDGKGHTRIISNAKHKDPATAFIMALTELYEGLDKTT